MSSVSTPRSSPDSTPTGSSAEAPFRRPDRDRAGEIELVRTSAADQTLERMGERRAHTPETAEELLELGDGLIAGPKGYHGPPDRHRLTVARTRRSLTSGADPPLKNW